MVEEIVESKTEHNETFFAIGERRFIAKFVFPIPHRPGLVQDENKWVLRELKYNKAWMGKSVKRRHRDRVPRGIKVGVFDELDQCREFVKAGNKVD